MKTSEAAASIWGYFCKNGALLILAAGIVAPLTSPNKDAILAVISSAYVAVLLVMAVFCKKVTGKDE